VYTVLNGVIQHCGRQFQVMNDDCSGSSPFNAIIPAPAAMNEENIDPTS